MERVNAEAIADEIITLYSRKGGENYSGEKITQLEHACQTAGLAKDYCHDDELILGAFLHDIGHLLDDTSDTEDMDGFGVKDHEAIGAKYLLERGFSHKVTVLVKCHVEAKRYLCTVDENYYNNLSEASRMTLQFQGGLMREDELDVFDRNPLKDLIIKTRMWDEEAKLEDVPLADLSFFRDTITAHLVR